MLKKFPLIALLEDFEDMGAKGIFEKRPKVDILFICLQMMMKLFTLAGH